MYLQPLYTKNDVDARIFHTFAPLYIAGFVETRQQLNYHRHFFPVLGRSNQGFHHLAVFSQTVKSGFDRLDTWGNCGLAQQLDIMVERMIRHVQETVFFTNQVQHASCTGKLRQKQRFPCRIFQIATAAIRKLHQVFMVLVTSAGQGRIEFVERQVQHNLAV